MRNACRGQTQGNAPEWRPPNNCSACQNVRPRSLTNETASEEEKASPKLSKLAKGPRELVSKAVKSLWQPETTGKDLGGRNRQKHDWLSLKLQTSFRPVVGRWKTKLEARYQHKVNEVQTEHLPGDPRKCFKCYLGMLLFSLEGSSWYTR